MSEPIAGNNSGVAMKCDELLKALNDFVDGDIDPGICEDFEQHLHGCNPCQVVVDNIRQTIAVYKGDEPYPMPDEFHQRLRKVLRDRWRKKFGES
jgi:anti-sigma factor RsiW